ncbi:unnamed protein product [Allacma fusca]|uniref:Uncharacterized protein n=1 Tax=Allacma fusca TaxID=39272 RepID=A0A8J2L9Z0_9HEXA|nr:unnamed protein product [Allacma fusca]
MQSLTLLKSHHYKIYSKGKKKPLKNLETDTRRKVRKSEWFVGGGGGGKVCIPGSDYHLVDRRELNRSSCVSAVFPLIRIKFGVTSF